MSPAEIVLARSAEEFAMAGALLRDYAADIGLDLAFQNFAAELCNLAACYSPPGGGLLLLKVGQRPAGCVAVRPLEDATAELKRMYIRPGYRGRGLGRRLAEEALALARRLGYRTLRLDTLPGMRDAIGLYRRLGFSEIDAYRFNPVPGARFFELRL